MMKYGVIYEKTATGDSCYAPDLTGCAAAGNSIEEAKRMKSYDHSSITERVSSPEFESSKGSEGLCY